MLNAASVMVCVYVQCVCMCEEATSTCSYGGGAVGSDL